MCDNFNCLPKTIVCKWTKSKQICKNCSILLNLIRTNRHLRPYVYALYVSHIKLQELMSSIRSDWLDFILLRSKLYRLFCLVVKDCIALH